MSDPTTRDVVRQAQDDSWLNKEPAMVRGAVISAVGGLGAVLVVAGVLDEGQKQALADNAGAIAFAVWIIVPILQSAWTRLAVWSPRTAAQVAVASAETGVPTLTPES